MTPRPRATEPLAEYPEDPTVDKVIGMVCLLTQHSVCSVPCHNTRDRFPGTQSIQWICDSGSVLPVNE